MSIWTEENVATLTKLWTEGHSASIIAKQIPGSTRSGVIGKVHRIGLPERKSRCNIIRLPSKRPRQRWARPQRSAPPVSSAPLPPPPPVPATALRLTLMQLTDQTCKCGIGDPKRADFAFCGLPVKPGSRYCPGHHGLFYSAIRTKNAAAKIRHHRPRIVPDNRFEQWAA